MFVELRAHTMAALFRNEYSAGSVLALVTWNQRENPHWFDGRIPDTPLSVEFVEIGTDGSPPAGRRFDGPVLKEDTLRGEDVVKRLSFLLNLSQALP